MTPIGRAGSTRSPTFLGPGVSRGNAFTMGTEQEVDFLVDALGARAAGCACSTSGAGRAGTRSRSRGAGSTWSASTCRPTSSRWRVRRPTPSGLATRDVRGARRARARRPTASSTPSICLCQGGFGLLGGGDDEATVFARVRARRCGPGGGWRSSAFCAYFAVRHLEAGDDVRRRDRRAPRARDGARPGRRRARVRPLDDLLHAPRADAARARGAGSSSTRVHGVTPGPLRRGAAVDRSPRAPAARAPRPDAA